MAGNRSFFSVGEYDLALEEVYVAHKKHSGPVDREALARQFRDWPIPGLEDIVVIERDLSVGGL